MLLVSGDQSVEVLLRKLNQKEWPFRLEKNHHRHPKPFAIVLIFFEGVYPYPVLNIGIEGGGMDHQTYLVVDMC